MLSRQDRYPRRRRFQTVPLPVRHQQALIFGRGLLFRCRLQSPVTCLPLSGRWTVSMPAAGRWQRASSETYKAVSETEVSTVVQVVAVPAGIVPRGSVSTWRSPMGSPLLGSMMMS